MIEKKYDINIEAAIISSIIYHPTLLDSYLSKINSNLFFLPYHKKIIDLILNLYTDKKSIDEDIIRNKLGNKYENELINILTKTPLNNLDDYIEILKDYKTKRDIEKFTLDILKKLESNTSGIELQAEINNIVVSLSLDNQPDVLDIYNINNIEDKDVEFITKNWLPFPIRAVSLVTAPGGTGKSWFILQMAIRAIEEGAIKKAFLWLSEDPKEISRNRFNKIFNKVTKSTDNSIKNKIDISDSPTIQFLYDTQKKIEVSPLFTHFKIKMQKYDLIVLDPLIAFYGADENNNSSARRFMQLFTDWANKENKTIIFIHHSTKNTTQSRGASAFVDAVRTVYEIDKVKDDNGNMEESTKRVIKLTKDNYGVSHLLNNFSVMRDLFPERDIPITTIEYKEKMSNSIPDDF